MLTTSISLPASVAQMWRTRQHDIMKAAVRMLRIYLRHFPLRRGVTRSYNRTSGDYQIVCTRFSAAEYDALHCAAAGLRVSVSSLVYRMICLWLKPTRRRQDNRFVANYNLILGNWGQSAGIYTECLLFYPKMPAINLTHDGKNKP
ncbi:MAG: hypothetical protein JNJ69_07190 [Leptospiraceae bacterium]|nr:hypothetical protein [Leptospiraceae bacterium]